MGSVAGSSAGFSYCRLLWLRLLRLSWVGFVTASFAAFVVGCFEEPDYGLYGMLLAYI